MLLRRLAAALAVALSVSSCIKVDRSPPKDLPDYATLYPGATNTVSMNMGPMSAVVFQAPASPDEVVAFYRNEATNADLPETRANAVGPAEQKQAAFADQASGRMLVIVARPGAQGAGSLATLTYKPQPKAPS